MTAENPRVLCVDDDPANLRLLEAMLVPRRYDIIRAENAEQALERFSAIRVDIVLTDIMMPVVSGIDLLEKIHDVSPETPVILMTAFADTGKAIQAVKKEAFDFLIKPFNQEQLVSTLEKAFRYSRLVRMEADYKRILEDFNQQIETLVAERTMSLMSLTVADKIRNPSCVIKGLCNRILKMDEVGGKAKEELRMISQEADKLEKIVVEFQDLFMEKRSLFTREDLNLVVMDIIPIIKKECAHQEINLHIDLASNSLKMNMQKNLFRAAVFHVLKNAVEATPQGGRIIVATEAGSDSVELRISNSGPGISPQDLPKIFDPFFSTKKQRFGMGLSLVKQIISEHLGRISVSSEPLNGTTFTLTFPVNWFGKGEVKPA